MRKWGELDVLVRAGQVRHLCTFPDEFVWVLQGDSTGLLGERAQVR
jgi:hypothetical protein